MSRLTMGTMVKETFIMAVRAQAGITQKWVKLDGEGGRARILDVQKIPITMLLNKSHSTPQTFM